MTDRQGPIGRTANSTGPGLVWVILLAATLAGANAPRAVAVEAESARMTPAVRAVQQVAPSVVNIKSVKISYEGSLVFGSSEGHKVNGMGTGIVIDPRGYIATNYHVVADVKSLTCTMFDGSMYDAHVVAADPERDLAIIKIKPAGELPVTPLGTSSDLMLCETVIAIGNAFGYEHTVTKGIVSHLHRDVEVNASQSYENLIQIDAAINPGNSGGPLVNLEGEVVGINVAIRAGAERIGFAIPIDQARKAIAALMSIERLDDHTHGLLTKDVKSSADLDLVVTGCEESSPAAAAGFQEGDVVTHVAGQAVRDRADLERLLLGRQAGTPIPVLVERDGQTLSLKLVLAPLPTEGTHMLAGANDAEDQSEETSPAWTILGLRLESAPPEAVAGTIYEGGLKVLSVRHDSPAARTGIRPGDILVGLHKWATVRIGDVKWVLENPELSSFSPLRFYVLGNRGQGQKTLSGRLTLIGNP